MTRPDGDRGAPELLWDRSDNTPLHDGYRLGWLIDETGTRWPFVLDDQLEGATAVPYGQGLDELAPHERTGRMPRELRERMGLLWRCGAPTSTTGRPCRSEVATPGARCAIHRRHQGPGTRPVHEQLRLLDDEDDAT